MQNIVLWIKRYAVGRFLWHLGKAVLPIVVAWLFWPDIDAFLGRFDWWASAKDVLAQAWEQAKGTKLWELLSRVWTHAAKPAAAAVSEFMSNAFSDVKTLVQSR